MSIEIKQSTFVQKRQAFANLQRRYGTDKPASRYDEAVMDVQPTTNFHYRPLWQPELELYDERRTAVRMADWYALRDVRQLYYATYNISRAAMSQDAERALELVERGGMIEAVQASWRESFATRVLPLRHYEWAANMNAWSIADYGYGTAITSAAAFCAADRLGMAQLLSRIGLVIDDNSGRSLDQARNAWLEAESWQPLRRAVEDSFVLRDWFETFVAQHVALDGILHPLAYDVIDAHGREAHGATALGLMTAFMTDWFADQSRWVFGVLARAATESEHNRRVLSELCARWVARAVDAALPIAQGSLGEQAEQAVAGLRAALAKRLATSGIELEGGV